MILRGFLFSLLIPLFSTQITFNPSLDIGGYLRNTILPDEETMGGISSIFDRSSKVDLSHTGCGQRTMCEVLSNRRIGEDEDTGLQKTIRDAGLVRKAVDFGINGVTTFFAPVLNRVGLGALARSDVSLFDVFVDALDDILIYGARFLAGTRFSRQIEDVAPIRSAINIVGPLVTPPTDFYPNLLDLAVDMTGVLDRDRGSYNYVRAGILGYYQGDNGVCDVLQDDVTCENGHWSLLPPASTNRLGEIVQGKIHGRTRRTDMDDLIEEGFSLKDLTQPKKLLCKIDAVLGLLNGHIDNVADGEEFVDYDFEIVEEDDAVVLERLKIYNATTPAPLPDEEPFYDDEGSGDITRIDVDPFDSNIVIRDNVGHRLVKKKITTRADKFHNMCIQESRTIRRKNIEKLMKDIQNNGVDSDIGNVDLTDDTNSNTGVDDYDDYEDNGDGANIIDSDIFDVKDKVRPLIPDKEEQENEEEEEVNTISEKARSRREDLQKVALISNKSFVIDKIDEYLETESDRANFVYDILKLLAPKTTDSITGIHNISKSSYDSLLVTLNNSKDRDTILLAYRNYGKRSQLDGYIRRPRRKDIKKLLRIAGSIN